MIKYATIGAVVVFVGIIAFIVAAALLPPEFRQAVRDIMISILGIMLLVTTLLMTALLFAILYAVQRIDQLTRTTVLPKIDETMARVNTLIDDGRTITSNVRDTVTTTTSTTGFVAERVAAPVIRVSALLAGVRAAAVSLARRGS